MVNIEMKMSRYPIVVVQTYDEPTLQEIEVFFQELSTEISQRSGPFVFINKTSGKIISSQMRNELGLRTDAFIKQYFDRYLGSAVIVESSIARMMIQATLLLVRNSKKVHIVSSLEKAEEFARKLLVRANVAV